MQPEGRPHFLIRILSGIFIFGAIYSIYSLLVFRTERGLDGISVNASLQNELLAQTLAERSDLFARARLHVERGIVASKQAQVMKDEAKRTKLLCEGLSEFGEALSFEPRDPRYLVNWANLRQTLGDITCPQPLTSGNFREAVSLALAESPTSPDVLYAASLVQHWSGDSKEAKESLRRVLLLGTEINDSQKAFLFSMIRTPEDFEAIVPYRFPQIVTWISYLKSRKVKGFDEVFSRAFLIALNETVKEYKNGVIPIQYHIARLASVYDLEVGDEVRRVIDGIVQDIMTSKGDGISANYFKFRSGLAQIDVVRGIASNDIRPFKTPLIEWGYSSMVHLDSYHQSIGFYLPENFRVSLIELLPNSETSDIEPTAVKLFVSDDNQKWNEIAGMHPMSGIRFGRIRVSAIQNQGAQGRYWKITYDRPDRFKRFGNYLNKFIKVYGERNE